MVRPATEGGGTETRRLHLHRRLSHRPPLSGGGGGQPKDFVRSAYGLMFLVCTVRIWEHWSNTTLYSRNFVMVDRKGAMAEGITPVDKMSKFKNSIQEEMVYMKT